MFINLCYYQPTTPKPPTAIKVFLQKLLEYLKDINKDSIITYNYLITQIKNEFQHRKIKFLRKFLII